ncbi:MAG TPA: hypothetical protein PLJ65_01860 [Casimicrobium sp.]|nr:hypothetical protein [Casimicrobium sp.]
MKRKGLIIWCVVWTSLWAIVAYDAVTEASIGYPWGPGILMYVLSLPLSSTYYSTLAGPDFNRVLFSLYCTVSSFVFWFVLVPIPFRLIRTFRRIKNRSEA